MAEDTGQEVPLSGISAFGDVRYLPALVDVDNLAIGVSDSTLSNLNLLPEHLIVGERLLASSNGASNVIHKSYGLIVDNHGVLVNSSIQDRSDSNTFRPYALHVEGSMYVSGSLHASNIILDVGLCNDITRLASIASSNPWRLVNKMAHCNAAFYDGFVTIGNENFASVSAHPLIIVEPGDRTIYRTQFAVANTQLSKLSVGIIGNDKESPVVFNSSFAPIEFNVGRPASYYPDRYQEYYVDTLDNNALKLRAANIPMYTGRSVDAPQLAIDKRGNVGVHIAETPIITYQRRERPSPRYDPSYIDYHEPMTFAVNGPMYASNILIYDPDTHTSRDINTIFSRINGAFLPANQVLPGEFAKGDYTFPVSLSVATSNEAGAGFAFAVASNAHFHDYVKMDKTLEASNVQTDYFLNRHGGHFLTTLDVDGTSYLYGDLVVYKGITVAEEDPATGEVSYRNVQFNYFSDTLSNINYFGRGITTPGRLGVGISPTVVNDTPGNMLTIRNRETHLPKLYELELMDLRDPNMRKVAFLGHTHTSLNRAFDGSFVISTPHSRDARYFMTSTYLNPYQNIYLYPGHDLQNVSEPLIRPENPPIFGAFAPQVSWRLRSNISEPQPSDIYGRCGINTFNPMAELHVEGDIAFTHKLLRINDIGEIIPVGIWDRIKLEHANTPDAPQFYGLQYIDTGAPHVGINILPSPDYGLLVSGKIKSIDGFYTAEDREIISWIRPNGEIPVELNAPPLYSQGPIGIGITNPKNVMEIRNRVSGPTYVHLIASDNDHRVGFRITGGMGVTDGTSQSHTWYMQDNANTNAFEMYATQTNTDNGASPDKLAWQVVRNVAMNTYNTFINRTPDVDISRMPNLSTNAALTVCGDLNVIGNVYATQKYYSSNILITSSNIQTNDTLNELTLLGTDDVFIAGRNIHMLPVNGTVIVGANTTFMQRVSQETGTGFGSIPFRINNGSTDEASHPVALSLSTTKNQCYLEFNATGRRLWMGLENETFSVKRVDNTTGATVQTFMTFNNVGNTEGIGFNELNPKAQIHISNTSSNNFRVTRKIMSSIGGAYPTIQMETLTLTQPSLSRVWSFAGPDYIFQDKLSFYYKDETRSAYDIGQELFTFSSKGGLGIGNTQPQFALDVKNVGSYGGLRLWNTDSNALPQLIFQSGPSETFGGDPQTDFRMLAYSNMFELNSQTQGSGSTSLIRMDQTGRMGFGIDPYPNDDIIRLNVNGGINITDTIYVNGVPLFGAGRRSGFTFEAENIFVIPTAETGGSFLVNSDSEKKTGTGNIFQIYVDPLIDSEVPNDGVSRGIVLDGLGNEVQLTFRTHDTSSPEVKAYMYRHFQYKTLYGIEFMDPAPLGEQVEFGHEGWSNVVNWAPKEVQNPLAIRNEFVMTTFGDIELSAVTPKILLGQPGLGSVVSIGQTNGNLWFESSEGGNVGFGTIQPAAYVHIINANAADGVPALFVEHNANDSNHLAVFGELSNPDVVITADGRMGVGVGNTVNSNVAAEFGGVIAMSKGTIDIPALAFRDDLNTGWWSPANGMTALSSIGKETVRFDDLRAVGIGTSSPLAHVHVSTTNASVAHTSPIRSMLIDYNYPAPINTPIYDLVSSNITVIRATNDARIGFGTSPTTADFQVAKAFEFESTGTFNKNVLFKENILVLGDVRHRGVVTHDSDRRLKSDLQKIDGALDKIDRLTGYTFNIQNGTKRSTGLIAQDVKDVLPEAVEENPDTSTLGVAYGNMMGLIVEAIKELRNEVADIKRIIGMPSS